MSNLREFGLIRTGIWQSERFKSLKTSEPKLAYIWLHTSFKTSAGVMRVGPAHLLDEVDFVDSLDHAEELFKELEAAGLIIRNRPFIIITKYVTANPIKAYRHAIGAFREVLALHNSDEKQALMKALQKQKGAMDLVKWRDKNGEPHEVLHEINAFFAEFGD